MLEAVIPGDCPLQHRNNWKIPEENGDKNWLFKGFRIVQTYIRHTCLVQLKSFLPQIHFVIKIKEALSVFFTAESILLLCFIRCLFIFIAPKSQNLVDNSNKAMFCISFKVLEKCYIWNQCSLELSWRSMFLISFTALFYEWSGWPPNHFFHIINDINQLKLEGKLKLLQGSHRISHWLLKSLMPQE